MTEIKEMMIPKGTAARPGYAMTPKYITIHNTANAATGAGAESHGRYMTVNGGQNKQVSYHYVVDDKLIVRLLPDTENAWHAGDGGSGTGNRKSLAIEICENPESDLTAATDNAAELTARLMKDWGIALDHVVQHNHWSGKNCPHLIRAGKPYGWQTYLAKVRAYRDALDMPAGEDKPTSGALWTVQTGAFRSSKNAQAYCAVLSGKGIPCWAKLEGGMYRVQCGAFGVRDNAEAYASTLAARGVETYVRQREE